MEEFQMKTQESEFREVRAQGIVMIAFYVLVMAGILIITGGNSQETALRLKGSEIISKDGESVFASTSNPATALSESYMNNLYEALEPAVEPALEVSELLDIHFPVIIKKDASRDYTDDAYIQNMLEEKNREIAAELELIHNMKEYLKVDTEKPLEVENWMYDDSFWIPGSK
jgi:hypothetical protein